MGSEEVVGSGRAREVEAGRRRESRLFVRSRRRTPKDYGMSVTAWNVARA